MSCAALFEALEGDTSRASAVGRLDPDCACEGQRATPWSPGPVADTEALARLIFSPIHFDEETRTIKEAAFDDCTSQGLSVERLAHANLDALAARAEQKANRDRQRGRERQSLGFVQAKAGEIRALRGETGSGRFCIYDTASAEHIAHAEVIAPRPAGKLERQRLRRRLQQCFARFQCFGAEQEESGV